MSMASEQEPISKAQIQYLMDMGYSVEIVFDGDPQLYKWAHLSSGESQSNYKNRQPFRRTQMQAWYDCMMYLDGDIPQKPDPDWAEN